MDRLSSIIEEERSNLVSGDRVALRETIARIEAKTLAEDEHNGSAGRSLLLELIKVGIELQNTDLILILVARLKLGQVALILQSKQSKYFALASIAEHFHIDIHQPEVRQQLLSIKSSDCDTLLDLKSTVKLFIDLNEWNKASEYAKDSQEHKHSLDRLICLKLARHHESMENFYEALVNYETSDTQQGNSIRVIIKQFLELSREKLAEYCLANASLHDFWYEFSFLSSSKQSANSKRRTNVCAAVDWSPARSISGLLEPNRAETVDSDSIASSLPDKMKKLIEQCNDARVWTNKRTLESVASMSASLDSSTRVAMLDEALRLERSGSTARACALFLCLDETIIVSHLGWQFLNKSHSSQLTSMICPPEASAVHSLQMLRPQQGARRMKSGYQSSIWLRRQESLFFSVLNLGLLDETLRCYCDVYPQNEDTSTKQILDTLKNVVANRHSGQLDRIDPTIHMNTLSMLSHSLASERIPITPVIAILIYCMAIFTYKLDYCSDFVPPVEVLSRLETMFEQTRDCMQRYAFNATSSLVRSTSTLVTAIKEKLDLVADSETIRTNIRELVESVASRCLVESQFKQAATLYSQIDDHVNAIKSLMRSGDMDTVMNYSLLVRDITLERLTINYLRHLDVGSTIIEEFIAKSKRQQQ